VRTAGQQASETITARAFKLPSGENPSVVVIGPCRTMKNISLPCPASQASVPMDRRCGFRRFALAGVLMGALIGAAPAPVWGLAAGQANSITAAAQALCQQLMPGLEQFVKQWGKEYCLTVRRAANSRAGETDLLVLTLEGEMFRCVARHGLGSITFFASTEKAIEIARLDVGDSDRGMWRGHSPDGVIGVTVRQIPRGPGRSVYLCRAEWRDVLTSFGEGLARSGQLRGLATVQLALPAPLPRGAGSGSVGLPPEKIGPRILEKVEHALSAGDTQLKRGQVDEAMVHYREAVAADPHCPQALMRVAYVQGMIEHERQMGLANYQKALEALVPWGTGPVTVALRVEARVNMAALHMDMATERGEARSRSYTAHGHLEKAGALLTFALEDQPNNPEALVNLGRLHLLRCEPEEALDAVRAAESHGATIHSGETALNKGMALAMLGRHKEAIGAFKLAAQDLSTSARSAHAWYGLGTSYYRLGDYEQSAMCLETARNCDHTLWQARFNLACSYQSIGLYEAARKELDKIPGAARGLPETRIFRAKLLAQDGALGDKRWQAAAGELEAVLDRKPLPDARRSEAQRLLNVCHLRQIEFAKSPGGPDRGGAVEALRTIQRSSHAEDDVRRQTRLLLRGIEGEQKP